MKALKQSSVFLLLKMTVFERSLGTRFGKYSSPIATTFAFLFVTLLSSPAHGGVFVSANGRIDTYLTLHEGGMIYEVPDCAHSKFGPHITQQYDDELGEYVFAFHVHTAFDNDRCIVFDRQRTEIATFQSKALKNEIRTYRWRFRLGEEFLPSTFWNHIFQIRPIDPIPGGNPIFTFSTLSGETEELLFYQDVGNGMKVLFRTPLEKFKGRWIDAYVRAKFSPSGFIEVKLKSTLDETVLLEWKRDEINLWPSDITLFTLPKWGNYRSLKGEGPLRDEVVLYNDFCVAEEGESCERLEMLGKFQIQVTPAVFRLSTDISIDPFPTDKPFATSVILHFLREALSVANRRQPSTLSLTSAPADRSITEERHEERYPITIECVSGIKWRYSKWARVINPFVEQSVTRYSSPARSIGTGHPRNCSR